MACIGSNNNNKIMMIITIRIVTRVVVNTSNDNNIYNNTDPEPPRPQRLQCPKHVGSNPEGPTVFQEKGCRNSDMVRVLGG